MVVIALSWLFVASLVLNLVELLMVALLWPPYVRHLSRTHVDMRLPSLRKVGELTRHKGVEAVVFRSGEGELVFRRVFAAGKGRVMYMGVLREDAAGVQRLHISMVPGSAPYPIALAMGAFVGSALGLGDPVISLGVMTGVSIVSGLLLNLKVRESHRCFVDEGLPALSRVLIEHGARPPEQVIETP